MRKKPQQARSKKTRQQLMQALEQLLRDKDFDQITVVEIAEAANVSTGLLYSHFANKADFLEALLDEYKARVIERLEEVEKEDVREEFRALGNLRDTLRLVTKFAYDQLIEDAHIIRAISHFLKARSDAEKIEWEDLRQRAFHTIVPALEVYENEIERPINALTAQMVVYFFNTIFLDALLNPNIPSSNTLSLNRDVFTSEIADFVYGYLRTHPAPCSL